MDNACDLQAAHLRGLLSVPDELILGIAEYIPNQRDLARFLRVNRRLHVVLRDLILQRNIKYSNSSALICAVRRNHVEVVFRMVRLKADLWVSCNDDRFWPWVRETPLQLAVEGGNLRLVKILTKENTQNTNQNFEQVDEMQRLRATNECKQSLHLALEKKNERIARVLVNRLDGMDAVINTDTNTMESKTALHTACDNRLVGATRYLLSKGADPNFKFRGNPSFRYIESLLAIKDSFQRRLDEDTMEILRLLFAYGLEPDKRLRTIGGKHSDSRVRWLFGDRTVRPPQVKPNPTTEESLALFLDSKTLFPPLASDDTRKKLACELHNVWAALTNPDFRISFLNHLTKTKEMCEPSEMSSSASDADPFPPLCLVCPEMNKEAQRRWAVFKSMEQHRRQLFEASRSRRAERNAVKHPESKKENFPSLSSNVVYTNEASSSIWTNYRRCDVSNLRNEFALSVPDVALMKAGGRGKTKWRKLPL